MKGKPKSFFLFPERNVSMIWCFPASLLPVHTHKGAPAHTDTQVHRITHICTLKVTDTMRDAIADTRRVAQIPAYKYAEAHMFTHKQHT